MQSFFTVMWEEKGGKQTAMTQKNGFKNTNNTCVFQYQEFQTYNY